MTEVKLDTAITENVKEPKRLFAICNENGLYLKNYRPYWTNDLNMCIQNLRSENTQIDRARDMLKTRKQYDDGDIPCFNHDLYYGFEKLYIKEVKVAEV